MESYLVTRPAFRGLRIAHSCKTSNVEAHAVMTRIWLSHKSQPRRHLSLRCLDKSFKICEVSKSPNKASDKRLLICPSPPNRIKMLRRELWYKYMFFMVKIEHDLKNILSKISLFVKKSFQFF